VRAKGVYDRTKKQWRIGSEKCHLKYAPPKDNQGRNCFEGIISACPTKTETGLAKKCQSYSGPVEDINSNKVNYS
jgi:hypothetical protein